MSKEMTPCEKLGYKVGDKFTVIKDFYFEKGTIVALSEDDGSEVPWFTCGGVRRALIIGSNPDVEQTPSKLKPAKLKPAKQALADAIHQNGGWPIEVHWLFSTSGRVGAISFWARRPKFNSTDWFEGVARRVTVTLNRGLPNWHQCILSREEYYHAYPKADADGWIEHDGKHEPAVATSGLTLWCMWSDGLEQSHEANMVDWIDDSDVRIIAYRLHKPDVKPEFCESVTSSIPEPESIDGLCAKVTEENKHQHVDAKPTIEQLAQDYRSKLDFAKRKQQEADGAKADAKAKLAEMVAAGKAIGLVLSVEHEVSAITPALPQLIAGDWRSWRQWEVGDLISWSIVGHVGEFRIISVHHDPSRNIGDFEVEDKHGGVYRVYGNECKFIRRP